MRVQRPGGTRALRPNRAGSRGECSRSRTARGDEGRDRGTLPPDRGRRHPDDGGARFLGGRDPDAREDSIRGSADDREPARGCGRRLRGGLQAHLLAGQAMSTMAADYRMYIAGAWTDSESGARMEATSPATGEKIGTVPEGTREDVRRAISAANDAWGAWAGRSAFERAAAMERVAEIIEERREDLARTLTLDQGKPLEAEAYDEVDELTEYFAMAAADATRLEGSMPPSVHADKRVLLYRVPRGVVGVITPWNWPYTMPAEMLAPALASGNSAVWVPAPSTSVCAVKLAECIVDAELPEGIFNMVTGPGAEVGDEVAANSGTQAVGFIGSIQTGQKVATRAAGKALLLEDRKSTRLNSSHANISYAAFCLKKKHQ